MIYPKHELIENFFVCCVDIWYICVYVCMRACVHMYVYEDPKGRHFIFTETGLSLNQKFTEFSRLSGQQVPGILLPSPLQF